MAVTITGMFGSGSTYFADSPVVITVSGLDWGTPVTSPFTIVRLAVIYDGSVVGEFKADTGGQTSITFDISSALRAIWAGYDYSYELAAAAGTTYYVRSYRSYSLKVYTEYLDSQDGELTTTESDVISGGRCMMGRLTEVERSLVPNAESADASYWNGKNNRYGDASTKPVTSPERVGRDSITSWVDVSNDGTTSYFYAKTAGSPAGAGAADSGSEHAPLVLRDSIPYTDFLFVNRRGAVETCSARMLEAMNIEVNTETYARIERPSFTPSRSVMAIASGGRRSWQMSSGYVPREWAEWWTEEFLMGRRHWMLYKPKGAQAASYVPVIVEPAKKQTGIYDRTKQQMPHVDFTVTLALEG